MKNIQELLSEYGVSIPEDKITEFTKSFAENYKTVNEVDNLKSKIKSAEETAKRYEDEIKNRNDDLTNLKKQLSDTAADKENIANLQNKIAEMQATYDKSQQEYQDKINAMNYENAVKEQVSGLKFTSLSAKKAFMSDIMNSNLVLEEGKILGFNDFVEKYKNADADAFVKEVAAEEKPKFTAQSNAVKEQSTEKKEIPKLW